MLHRLRRSDSNSRPNVRPAGGVPDHRVSKKQAKRRREECDGYNSDVKPALKRGHYAVEVDLPLVKETLKGFPGG